MKNFIFLNFIFLFGRQACGSGDFHCGKQITGDSNFIVGAPNDDEKNPVGHWPWMASLGFYDDKMQWQHQCGATLVSTRFFLTAAHCAKTWYKVQIGDTNHGSNIDDRNAFDLDILNQTTHPNYDGVTSYFDIALLETSPVTLSRSMTPICLPELPSNDIHKYDNYFVELIGWGQKDLHGVVSQRLRRVSLRIHPLSYCNRTHISSPLSTKAKIESTLPHLFQNHILCAGATTGSQGSCKGDSGGPLMYQDSETDRCIQIATVHGAIRDCGDSDFPGIYIRLDDPLVLNFIFLTIFQKEKKIILFPEEGFLFKYDGERRNRQPFGNGTMEYLNGDTYEGEWRYGLRNGTGTLNFNNEDLKKRHSYSGDWRSDHMTGNGTLLWKDGSEYEGKFENGLRNGFGRQTNSGGDIYEGEWKEDERSGYGTEILQDGTIHVGHFRHDLKNGFGKSINKGETYEGEWENGLRSGNGSLKIVNGTKVFEYFGEWKYNNPNGFGKLAIDGLIDIEGYFQNSFKDGNGTWKNNKTLVYEGQFKNLEPNGFGKLYFKHMTIEGHLNLDRGVIGNVTLTSKNGFKYEGELTDELRNGSIIFKDGEKYIGEFENGEPNGNGVHTLGNGDIVENRSYILSNGTKISKKEFLKKKYLEAMVDFEPLVTLEQNTNFQSFFSSK